MSSFRRKMMMNGKKKEKDYLCFTFLESGTLVCNYPRNVGIEFIEYSYNKKTWQKRNRTSFGSNININMIEGEKLYIRGVGTSCINSDNENIKFTSTAKHTLSGNIMSLLYSEDFEDKLELQDTYTFKKLFDGDSGLLSCKDLKLPATIITDGCYSYMFQNCVNLVECVKELPPRVLKPTCYLYMFYQCSKLTNTPNITIDVNDLKSLNLMFYKTNVTDASNIIINDLKKNSCSSMFSGCASLIKAPIINSYTIDVNSCTSMFYNNVNILYIKALFLTDNVDETTSIKNWLNGAKDEEECVFVKHINASWTTIGVSGVPTNWTIIYYNPNTDKYYLSDKTTECDDHGNVI